MAILYEDALKKDITTKNLANTYLLFGDDLFLKKSYFDKLSTIAYDGDEFFNLQKFEGDCDLQDVYNAVEQFPMMADRKCVCLTDYDFGSADKSDFTRLCELLESRHEECVLLLRFDSVEFEARNEREKLIISAIEKSGGKIINLDHKKPVELVKVIVDGAKKRSCTIDNNTAKYMIEVCGTDLNTLKNELDKLCFYIKSGTIDKSIIDFICIKSVEESIFDLTKKIFDGNPSGALDMLNSLLFMRIEPMIILHTLSGSYVDLYRVSTAKKCGKPTSTVAQDFQYKSRSFLLDRCLPVLQKFDDKKLYLSLKALVMADNALKSSGNEPRIVLEQLIIRLIYIIVKGEAVDKT